MEKRDREEKPLGGSNIKGILTVFLAGSIEMGKAEEWQKSVIAEFSDEDIKFYNPRREHWNRSWEQKESNIQFNRQVNWELDKLDKCHAIFMYFSPGTISPISLLEFGRYSKSKKMIVCCPDEFHRSGNVGIVCTLDRVPMYSNLKDAMGALRTVLSHI